MEITGILHNLSISYSYAIINTLKLINPLNILSNGYSLVKINDKVMVLSSSEVPVKIGDRTPGSTAFVPPAAGIMIASYVVKKLLNK